MRSLIFLLMLCVVSLSSLAQSGDEKEVADAVAKLRTAMIAADKPALESLTADSLSYGHSNGRIENKKEFIEGITSGRSAFVSMEISEQSISISDYTAIVRHELHAQTNESGKTGSIALKVLLVWIKEKGTWKLLARQAVKLASANSK